MVAVVRLAVEMADAIKLGVPRIVVGFRSRSGILERIEELNTVAIPSIVKQKGKASWDGNVCINFMATFLAC